MARKRTTERTIESYLDIGHYGFSDYFVWIISKGRLHVSDRKRKGCHEGHGSIFSEFFNDMDDTRFCGRFEVETGLLSICKPWAKRHEEVPEFVTSRLFQKFENISKVYEFS